jgi:hypothetical protein
MKKGGISWNGSMFELQNSFYKYLNSSGENPRPSLRCWYVLETVAELDEEARIRFKQKHCIPSSEHGACFRDLLL